MILERMSDIGDLRRLTIKDLPTLAQEIRETILGVISGTGGHLAPSLGVVELTIALHYVFNTPQDKIVWDVGHQCYAHKIITGRREAFRTIRQYGGISGFPKTKESSFDAFNAGHSSTSLSLALGAAVGRDLTGGTNKVVAVIGDGSMTGGMAYEALNNMGHLDTDVIIILNDNEHSISRNVGAMSNYLTRIITGSLYNRFRRRSMQILKRIPTIGTPLFNFIRHFFDSFKSMIIPGQLFEDMGIRYFGPIDGHDIPNLIAILERVKAIEYGPKLIHVITKKGKGYLPAEMDPARFHGVGPFDRVTGISLAKASVSYSEVAGKTLAALAQKDPRIVAVTAAMKLGTGLYEFEKKVPERFFDVGIAEQHAVTFAGALAASGLRPFVSIYSTFLQRAIDQLIHDIAIMNLPLRLLVDRAGIVGDDGETHHGLFDIALVRCIPNVMMLAPSCGAELRDMLAFAARYDAGPLVIRYPRGGVPDCAVALGRPGVFEPGRARVVARGGDAVIITFGDMVAVAMDCRALLARRGIAVAVVDLRTLKPLDHRTITRLAAQCRAVVSLESGVIAGGIGEEILANLKPELRSRFLFAAGFPDRFVTHGSSAELLREHGLDAKSLAGRIARAMKKL